MRHLLLLFLLLLFLQHALAFIFSVTRSFSLPEFSFFHSARRRGAWVVLRSGLAALCLVSQLSVRSRGALPRRLDLRRCACDSKFSSGRSCTPLPTPIIAALARCTWRFSTPGHWPCSSWGGRDGGICRGDRVYLPAPPARAATLRASPSSALPAGSSLYGPCRRKILFRFFF